MAAVASLEGTWELDHNENFDEFLKAAGIGMIKRGMATKLGCTLTITFMGSDKIKVKIMSGPMTKENEMPIGQTFESEGPAGEKASGSWTIEDGKMIGSFTTCKGKTFVVTREVQNEMLIQTMDIDGIAAKRFFKKK